MPPEGRHELDSAYRFQQWLSPDTGSSCQFGPVSSTALPRSSQNNCGQPKDVSRLRFGKQTAPTGAPCRMHGTLDRRSYDSRHSFGHSARVISRILTPPHGCDRSPIGICSTLSHALPATMPRPGAVTSQRSRRWIECGIGVLACLRLRPGALQAVCVCRGRTALCPVPFRFRGMAGRLAHTYGRFLGAELSMPTCRTG